MIHDVSLSLLTLVSRYLEYFPLFVLEDYSRRILPTMEVQNTGMCESIGNSPLSSPFESCDTPSTEKSLLFDDGFNTLLETSNDRYMIVTGGLGFIGSHTSLELLKAGYNVIIIDNLSNSFPSIFERVRLLGERYHNEQCSKCPSLQLHDVDYRNGKALRSLLDQHRISSLWAPARSNIIGVIHFAAFKAVEESIRQPLRYYSNNVSGLIDFTSILGEYGIKTLIFSSSATVYGTIANTGVPLKEEHCVHRLETMVDANGVETVAEQGCRGITNPYGRTKWMCEAILADLAFSDPEWTIVALRYFNPIGCDSSGLLGEDPKGIPTNLLPVVVKVMTGQYSELSMFGTDWDTADGTAIRDFIHVTDLARGHIAALSTAAEGRLLENFRTFNLGTGRGHSVLDVITAMESASRKTIPRTAVGRREGDVGSCVAVASRSAEELSWKTEKSLMDACEDICNFLAVSASS